MKPLLALLGLSTLLASCTPAVTGPQLGRIVNGKTGQEGTVAFTRGTLRPRLGDPFAPDNAIISLGTLTYTGRTVILDSAVAGPAAPNWGLRVGFGGGTNIGPNGFLGWGTDFGTPRHAASYARTGNLIARTAGNAPRTLTCSLMVDEREHGVGECTGDDGVKYALQF